MSCLRDYIDLRLFAAIPSRTNMKRAVIMCPHKFSLRSGIALMFTGEETVCSEERTKVSSSNRRFRVFKWRKYFSAVHGFPSNIELILCTIILESIRSYGHGVGALVKCPLSPFQFSPTREGCQDSRDTGYRYERMRNSLQSYLEWWYGWIMKDRAFVLGCLCWYVYLLLEIDRRKNNSST